MPMDQRPDPEELLKRVQDEEARSSRARFKVFFGAAPGVGKTYAMLAEAQRRRREGVDVLVGVVETHKRTETASLLDGLELLPRKSLPHRGVPLEEFDLEGALARRPGLILVDELAHQNAPGCQHLKRWQDVMDLLDAGIDVYTTVNVQHLESLKDVIAQITGIVVQERIPDTVLERCDEMELVDISVDELLQRLSEGKVYVPEQARYAIQRFFRRGNLLALRELALRRTAEIVDADMRRYRDSQGIQDTWAAGQRILVAITPGESSEVLIREARRMADSLGAPWMAVYVDGGSELSDAERERLESHLRLVERLGGEGIALPGHATLAEDLLALARGRNVTQIIIGRSSKPRWMERLQGSLLSEVSRQAGRVHVHVVPTESRESRYQLPLLLPSSWPGLSTLILCGLYVLAATLLGLATFRRIELADIVMIFTIPILVAAIRYGRNAALATSTLAVLALDFFFVPPRFTFTVGDVRHIGTFAILLGMGLVIGNLTERVRQQAIRAQSREQRTLALYRLGESLVQAGDQADTITSAVRAVESQFRTKVIFFLPNAGGTLEAMDDRSHPLADETSRGVAQWTFDHAQAAGQGTGVLPAAKGLFLPLKGAKGLLGVMGLQNEEGPLWQEPDQRHLLESFANQTALALERAALSAEAHATGIKAEREELRNALLSSVSHDLRTPLAGITGSATALLEDPGCLSLAERDALLGAIQDEAYRMHRLVTNLLDLTRLESGTLKLNREWLPAEEVVGSALSHLGRPGEGRDVRVEVDRPDTFLQGDGLLLEQLLINLVENALKFSPEDQPVEVRVFGTGKGASLMVSDHGPGIPPGMEERIFEKLFRGADAPSGRGAGLGLAICRGIAIAHGGQIQVSNRAQGGASFLVSLPYHGEPPRGLSEDLS
ncbi:MAG: osmosensitive channel signal transduction histidine kinase [Holophagaceae bacterium]|nr:osmosensitive channel signal transduction histidine kinase [Holophagaceae bacterium]